MRLEHYYLQSIGRPLGRIEWKRIPGLVSCTGDMSIFHFGDPSLQVVELHQGKSIRKGCHHLFLTVANLRRGQPLQRGTSFLKPSLEASSRRRWLVMLVQLSMVSTNKSFSYCSVDLPDNGTTAPGLTCEPAYSRARLSLACGNIPGGDWACVIPATPRRICIRTVWRRCIVEMETSCQDWETEDLISS